MLVVAGWNWTGSANRWPSLVVVPQTGVNEVGPVTSWYYTALASHGEP